MKSGIDLSIDIYNTQTDTALFNLAPDTLIKEIPSHLPDDALINLSESCKFLFFSLHLQYLPAIHRQINDLFGYVKNRDHEKAGSMVMKLPKLLMSKGEIADGFLDANMEERKFTGISPLQYLAWAKDIPVLYWLLLYWSLTYATEAKKQETITWINQLHEQAKAKNGVTYPLAELKVKLDEILEYVSATRLQEVGKHLKELELTGTVHGPSYDFSTLTTPLTTYSEHDDWSMQKRIQYWCNNVSIAQCQTVLQVAHEYCRPDRSFATCVKLFEDDHLPRTDEFCIDLGGDSLSLRSWRDMADLNLSGNNFAVLRSDFQGGLARTWDDDAGAETMSNDAAAIKHLHLVRDIQFKGLVEQLLNATSELNQKQLMHQKCIA